MKQLVQNYRTGEMKLVDVPAPAVRDGFVLVRTHFSVVSAGTEKSKVDLAKKSLIGKARARPDLVKQVVEKVKREGLVSTFHKVRGRLDSLTPIGYSLAGEVLAVGAGLHGITAGDLVACAGAGYANHAEIVAVPKNLCVKLPEGVEPKWAAFTTLGAIALQGVRQCDVRLGENVAVIGLGLIGQIAVQLLKAQGCRVLGIDIDPSKTELALAHGADAVAVTGRDDVERIADQFSGGMGIDASLITAASQSNGPVVTAGEIAREKGRVVVLGAAKMDIPRTPYYEKELEVRLSRSYGPGRYDPHYEEEGHDYPLGYVRWTEQRNMQEFLRLLATGDVVLDQILTHEFAFERAPEAYQMVSEGTQKYIGIVLDYGVQNGATSRRGAGLGDSILLREPTGRRKEGSIGFGLVGAGNYARGTLLPNLVKVDGVRLRAVATSSGLTARDTGEKFGFEVCAPSADGVINDPEVDCVVISTRHDSHAPIACKALEAGKAVFVEKPLAISEAELAEVASAHARHQGRLMVGFNRRFAPLIKEMKAFFANAAGPRTVSIRVNAGPIDETSWMHDPLVGGGRLVGEGCHFIDLAQHLVGSKPVEVFARAHGPRRRVLEAYDNAVISILYADGSVATVAYVADGDPAVGKERVEMFADGKSALLDDFRVLQLSSGGRVKTIKKASPDKGHRAELDSLVQSLRTGGPMPIPFDEIVASSLCTLRVLESLRSRKSEPCSLDTWPGDVRQAGANETRETYETHVTLEPETLMEVSDGGNG